MVPGGLLKALKSQDLLPFPTAPFMGFSFKSVTSKFSQMSLPTLCNRTNYQRRKTYYDLEPYDEPYNEGTCGVKVQINSVLSSLEGQLDGLELEQCFAGKPKIDAGGTS
jgi:hypothetical protein